MASTDDIRRNASARTGAQAGYAGDVTPEEAWAFLEQQPDAVLVDVRTREEWMFVGLPLLQPLGKEPQLISWQVWPQMAPNRDFTNALAEAGVGREQPVLVLCRSGARSRAAAIAATAAGYETAFNIAGGFEGDVGPDGHRGTVNGWKAAGLPWFQN
jgi:rhodanese-related sulfurtransferase